MLYYVVGEVLMDVLTIFYDNILKEAAQGRINSFFYYNIVFNTILDDEELDMMPVLI